MLRSDYNVLTSTVIALHNLIQPLLINCAAVSAKTLLIKALVGLRTLVHSAKVTFQCFFTIGDAMLLTGDLILLRATCSSQPRCYTPTTSIITCPYVSFSD